jgi:DNA-binding transcriptional regulator YiaG
MKSAKNKKKIITWDGERIRAMRLHLDMTQQEMGEELGTRQQTISEWETGLYKPRGASATVLNIVAERTGFRYRVRRIKKSSEESPPEAK